MSKFDGMKQPELRTECQSRGLPATGSNEDMIARLVEYDELIAGSDTEVEVTVAPVVEREPDPVPLTAPGVVEAPRMTEPTPKPAADDLTRIVNSGPEDATPAPIAFRAAYACTSELSTGLHEEFCRRVRADAEAAGYTPKSSGAHRAGWITEGGVRHAVYEVPLRRAGAGRLL